MDKIIWLKLNQDNARYLIEQLRESIKDGAVEINIPILEKFIAEEPSK